MQVVRLCNVYGIDITRMLLQRSNITIPKTIWRYCVWYFLSVVQWSWVRPSQPQGPLPKDCSVAVATLCASATWLWPSGHPWRQERRLHKVLAVVEWKCEIQLGISYRISLVSVYRISRYLVSVYRISGYLVSVYRISGYLVSVYRISRYLVSAYRISRPRSIAQS